MFECRPVIVSKRLCAHCSSRPLQSNSISAKFVAQHALRLLSHLQVRSRNAIPLHSSLNFSKELLVVRQSYVFLKSPQMYSAISLLAIFLEYYTIHALAPPTLADLTNPVPSTSLNLTTAFGSTTARLQPNNIDHSSNFLGVECYHLLPDTVSLISCQPLFARLLQNRRAYEQSSLRNGFRVRRGIDPCTVMLTSPDRRGDRRVRIALAEVVVYASEVLRTCQENDTGGAYVFQGNWRVVVTKYPLEIAAW